MSLIRISKEDRQKVDHWVETTVLPSMRWGPKNKKVQAVRNRNKTTQKLATDKIVPVITRPFRKLNELKQRLKQARKGYRVTKYEVFQETMENVVKLQSNGAALREFSKEAAIDTKKLKTSNTSWIASAAFTFVIGKEKEGWKAARVAEFLYGFKKVPIEELAEQMRKLGGIEAIVKLAAKENPRQLKPLGSVKKGGNAKHAAKKNPIKRGDVRGGSEGDDVDDAEDWDPPVDDAERPEGEDFRVTVRISPSLRVRLMAIETKRRVKLIGVRIDSDYCLQIQEVRQLTK